MSNRDGNEPTAGSISIVGTAHQTLVDTVTTPGTAIIKTPQDIDTVSDVTHNSIKAQTLQPNNTPTLATASGAGTGAPAINAQPLANTSLFLFFEVTFGTTPSNATPFATATYPTALNLSAGQIGNIIGVGYLTNAADGSLLTTIYAVAASATVLNIYTDKTLASSAHGFGSLMIFPY